VSPWAGRWSAPGQYNTAALMARTFVCVLCSRTGDPKAMGYPSDRRFALSFFLPLLAWASPGAALAQEIPLGHCGNLALIEVKVAEHPRWFLVDTAATAMLNLQSFAEGSSRDIRVTSWSGTLSTNEIGRAHV